MAANMEKLVAGAMDVMDKFGSEIMLGTVAQRGIEIRDAEDVEAVMKTAAFIRQGIASGEILPIPAAAIDTSSQAAAEKSAGMAKQACAQDPYAFLPDITITEDDMSQINDQVKTAASILAYVNLAGNQQ